MSEKKTDSDWMTRAIELAKFGQGFVEPNPMVGCVLVKAGTFIGQGWHEKFGGPHAEINAIKMVNDSGLSTVGATAYVSLEPCSHDGKTGPCSRALIEANVTRVVVAVSDPNPDVRGRGITELRNASIDVDVGIESAAARSVLAPYLKLRESGLPWIVAKWAMTLDGKIATRTGSSQWISNEQSRGIVHEIRGRVDAILVGAGTALADDPQLTARPPGHRVPTRVVIDSSARLSVDSKLCQTARQYPTLVAVAANADRGKVASIKDAGCEIWVGESACRNERLMELLKELGRREMTNVLVEGGGQLLGSLNELKQIDEVHAFIGGKLVGGAESQTPLAGVGVDQMSDAPPISIESVKQIEDDVYIVGRVVR